MAQKVQVIMTDDLDGGAAEETVSFGLDGRTYEIDLSEKNANKLRRTLHTYMESGRPIKTTQGRRSGARGAGNRERSAEIREWAKQSGIKVNHRGRIPANVVERFEAAH
ncbi:Lsr2 family protein [Actinomadura sp. KC06]|uniref:histone-like nucleoid-structuring protein Lsr2 n=1 Tax=Actinomadura sp. KC06 TaxID=2530369 RepID=UPI00104E79C6|nr:Lsr2 family protein [Actinomadura sp. KC06]TDD26646.1 Lsr2 family protein [Actinomadura sp. KC06]